MARIIPGDNMSQVYGFSGAAKGEMASAVYYRMQSTGKYEKALSITLQNPIAPLFAALADSGELVTLDNWHNAGIGKHVIALYAATGKHVRSYALADIYSKEEISKFEFSASSIYWRCHTPPFFDGHAGVLEIQDRLGANLEVNLKTGALIRTPGAGKPC
ncbi:hypothetical protein V8J88_02560 [Massilia sp. W12]|uniref:hypothetical protein n=1 Tax=Massilia sp. W12 TaxID=3126507 RepID=UPI0030D0B5E1